MGPVQASVVVLYHNGWSKSILVRIELYVTYIYSAAWH